MEDKEKWPTSRQELLRDLETKVHEYGQCDSHYLESEPMLTGAFKVSL